MPYFEMYEDVLVSLSPMDEPALIRAAQRGDLDAFNRLVLEYQSLAYNVAYRVLGEEPAAADATQEAFFSAYKHLDSYRGGSFRGWLLRIVTNACYDELRRRKRRPSVSLEDMLTTPDGAESESEAVLASSDELPEERVQRRELAAYIQDCLDRLPEEMRMVVVLCDVQGLDYAEIAAVRNIALGTVKSRLSRARARLRDCLQDKRELLPTLYRLGDEVPE
ncbi:MAG: sigma-70 family RNA polymerase sigma factor [Anaerolineales bacterium]|nr:sigma-70 family RNA polymerase sigma factor [Anaerolineales bacterium]